MKMKIKINDQRELLDECVEKIKEICIENETCLPSTNITTNYITEKAELINRMTQPFPYLYS